MDVAETVAVHHVEADGYVLSPMIKLDPRTGSMWGGDGDSYADADDFNVDLDLVSLPGLVAEMLNDVLDEVAPLAQVVLTGATIDRDDRDRRHFRTGLTAAATAMLAKIHGLYSDDPKQWHAGGQISEVTAQEAFDGGDRDCGVTADSSDDDLQAIADENAAAFAAGNTHSDETIIVIGGYEYLDSIRAELIAERHAEIAAQTESDDDTTV